MSKSETNRIVTIVWLIACKSKSYGLRMVRSLLFIILITFSCQISAQVTESDSASLLAPSEYYDFLYGVDQRLISGDYYYEPQYNTRRVTGHPFLDDEKWKHGYIIMDGVQFNNLELRLDIASSKVILKFSDLYSSELQISLKNSDVDMLVIDNHQLIQIMNNELNYYEIITSGRINYYLLQTKKLIEGTGRVSTDYMYQEFEQSFVQYNDTLSPLRSVKTLYNMFPEFKNQIKAFRNENKIKFKKGNHENIGTLIEYINRLFDES